MNAVPLSGGRADIRYQPHQRRRACHAAADQAEDCAPDLGWHGFRGDAVNQRITCNGGRRGENKRHGETQDRRAHGHEQDDQQTTALRARTSISTFAFCSVSSRFACGINGADVAPIATDDQRSAPASAVPAPGIASNRIAVIRQSTGDSRRRVRSGSSAARRGAARSWRATGQRKRADIAYPRHGLAPKPESESAGG